MRWITRLTPTVRPQHTAFQKTVPADSMRRKALTFTVTAGAALLCTLGMPAHAQSTSPNKPLKMIVGFAPGGAADVLARVIAQGLSSTLNQQVIVENKPGAEGILASQALLSSPADGYTFMLGTNTAMVAVPMLRPTPPYDPFTQFTPISSAGEFSMFLLVPSNFPASNIQQFLSEISKKPGTYNSASSNSASELAMLQLLGKERKVVNVRYKGDVPAMTDMVGGQIQMIFTTGTTAPGFVNDGRAKALVTLQEERSILLPQVPTAKEAGLGSLTIRPWAGFFAPAGVAKAHVDTLSSGIQRALNLPDVKRQLAQQGFNGYGMPSEQFVQFFKQQYQAFGQVIKDHNVKFE